MSNFSGGHAASDQYASHCTEFRTFTRLVIAFTSFLRQRGPRDYSRRPIVFACPSTTPLPIGPR